MSRHVIQRILFEIDVASEQKALGVQHRISDFSRWQLGSILEACLTELAPPDVVFSFDRIELDLGPVSEERMEDELARKIRRALLDALSINIFRANGAPVAQDGARTPVAVHRLHLLGVFLRRGAFPWSAQVQPPDALLLGLIEELPEEVRRLLRALGSMAPVRRRLAFQFAEPTLHRLIHLIETQHAELILTYAQDVQQVHRRRPIVAEGTGTFGRALWEFILTYLLVERGSYFNTRSFVKSTLQQMAQRYRVGYAALLAGLLARVRALQLPSSARYALPSLLLSLREETLTGMHPPPSPPAALLVQEAYAAAYTDLDLLAYFLLRGALPAWAKPAAASMDALFERLAAEAPDDLAALLRRLGRRAAVRRRLARQLEEPTRRRLVRVLEPQEAPFILQYTADLQTAHRSEPLVREEARGFGEAVWEFVLTYLLAERGSVFNTRMFVRSVLVQMAARFNVAYADLLAFMAAQAPEAPVSAVLSQRLVTLLRSLQEEVAAPPSEEPDGRAPPAADVAETLRQVLRYGLWPEAEKEPPPRDLARWLRRVEDATLREVLYEIGPLEQVVRRIVAQWPPSAFRRVVGVLAPGEAALILAYVASVRLARWRGGLIRERAAAFRQRLKEYVLAYLLQAPRASVSMPALIRATLEAVAARYHVAYARLLAAWGAGLASAELAAVHRQLERAASARPFEALAAPVIAGAEDHTEVDLLTYYLRSGAIPAWGRIPTEGALRSLLRRLLAEQPEALTEAWGPEMERDPGFRLRLRALLPEAAAALAAEAPPPTPSPPADEALTPAGRIDALRYFLRYGAVPWWGRALARSAPDAWFTDLLAKHAALLIPALRELADRPEGIRRLAQYLSGETLTRLVAILAPDYGGFVMTYLLAGARLADDDRLSPAQRRAVRLTQWTVLLERLLDRHAPPFHVADFVAEVGRSVARRLDLRYEVYQEALLSVARAAEVAEARFVPLAEALETRLPPVASAEEPSPDALPEAPALKTTAQAAEEPPPDALPEATEAAQRPALPAEEPSPDALPEAPALEAAAQAVDTAFLAHYFLQYGTFPPGAQVAGVRTLETLLRREIRRHPERYRRLFRHAAGEPLLRLRMVYQFSPSLLQAILRLLISEAAAFFGTLEALRPLMEAVLPGARTDAWQTLSLEHLLRAVRQQEGRSFDAQAFLTSLLQHLADEAHLPYPRLLARLRQEAGRLPRPLAPDLVALLERLERDAEAEVSIPPAEPSAPPEPTHWPYRQEDEGPEELPEEEPFYVYNAGLVLLWPFLNRYFNRLEMLAGNAFRDEQAAYRAVHLLQYLVSAETDVPEYHLVLNKVLCGVKTARPLDRSIELTDTERALSEDLLHGVTQHWSKLKNTSIDGLRQAFLQREGRLLKKDDGWSLHVASKPYDMLLDYLPWSLSTIRLPWMDNVLFVAWR